MTEDQRPLLNPFGTELMRIAREAGIADLQELHELLAQEGYVISPAELRREMHHEPREFLDGDKEGFWSFSLKLVGRCGSLARQEEEEEGAGKRILENPLPAPHRTP